MRITYMCDAHLLEVSTATTNDLISVKNETGYYIWKKKGWLAMNECIKTVLWKVLMWDFVSSENRLEHL